MKPSLNGYSFDRKPKLRIRISQTAATIKKVTQAIGELTLPNISQKVKQTIPVTLNKAIGVRSSANNNRSSAKSTITPTMPSATNENHNALHDIAPSVSQETLGMVLILPVTI